MSSRACSWRHLDVPPCSHHRVLVNQRNQSGHLRTRGTSWQGPKGQGLVSGLLYPCLAHLQRLEGKRGCKMRGTHHYLASQQAQGASHRRPPRAELLGEWRVLEGPSSAVAPGTLRMGGDRRWKTALCDTVAWPSGSDGQIPLQKGGNQEEIGRHASKKKRKPVWGDNAINHS